MSREWLIYHIAARQARQLDPDSFYGRLVNVVVWWPLRLVALASAVTVVVTIGLIVESLMGLGPFLFALAVGLRALAWKLREIADDSTKRAA